MSSVTTGDKHKSLTGARACGKTAAIRWKGNPKTNDRGRINPRAAAAGSETATEGLAGLG